MDAPVTFRNRAEGTVSAENAPGLPRCSYRRAHDGERYRCQAADGATVSSADCRACPIPEAVYHSQACLYLVPLRHQNEAHFACRWSFSWAREPTVRDWRDLCFCPYWFPRGHDEPFVVARFADTRSRYLRVLRGEEPRHRPRAATRDETGSSGDRIAPHRAWWRRLGERWQTIPRHLLRLGARVTAHSGGTRERKP